MVEANCIDGRLCVAADADRVWTCGSRGGETSRPLSSRRSRANARSGVDAIPSKRTRGLDEGPGDLGPDRGQSGDVFSAQPRVDTRS
jgi:hypothetical protein